MEDGEIRGDASDGTLSYMPADGLKATRVDDGTEIDLSGMSFNSSALCDDIFVLCASMSLSKEVAERFGAFCVEIPDATLLIDRFRARAHATSQLDYAQTIGGPIDYREVREAPGIAWALPDKLALIKPPSFAWQNEYRLAVGRRGAFDVHSVVCTISRDPAAQMWLGSSATIRLRLGTLLGSAKLHRL